MVVREKRVMNRWIVVAGALLIQLALGSLYAFSIFTSELSKSLGYDAASFQILGIFAAAIAVFAFTVIFAGRIQDRKGPRVVATMGGLILGAGYVLSTFATENIVLMYTTFGIIGGIGLGFGYVCPLAAGVKWFPDKKGLVSGIAVAGFGAGAFIFTQVGKALIDSYGLADACVYLGLIYMAMVVVGAQLLTNPPAGWLPKGYVPSANDKNNGRKVDYTQKEMMRTRSFLMLWVMFALSGTAGLMMISNVKNLAIFLDPTSTTMVVAEFQTIAGILALFNAAGRIGWGKLSDKLGRTNTLKLMFLIQAIILFGAAGFFALRPTGEIVQFVGLTSLASLVGFTFGGNFALFPSTTSEYYGTKNFGNNYGYVFTSYGLAGALGALIPGVLAGSQSGFVYVFVAVGIASLVAFGVALATRPPVHVEVEPLATPVRT
ncbi:MAG: OFA family MFS transporter [Candidatus Thermoplasmatota archaeon]|nr:OFA family MFS transporter [Candidatus Thermoplasmatota archaeon]